MIVGNSSFLCIFPKHFGETDTSKVVNLLKETPEIEVRIRNMK